MDSGLENKTNEKVKRLQDLINGPLSSSIAKLSASSRAIPSEKDFHFYYNFKEFKVPVKEMAEKSEATLKNIGSSRLLRGQPLAWPDDPEDSYDWLVNIQDEILERFDISADEFQRLRKKQEENGIEEEFESGFQVVYGKKKKKGIVRNSEKSNDCSVLNSTFVKVVSRDSKSAGPRSKMPFHIPTITRPQDEYNIWVNNSNEPFEHVCLKKSEDGSRFIHPLDKFSELDFVDRNIGDESMKPLPLESTPFMFLEEVNGLKELAAKLHDANEFAVDLEHNQYRSFQGMTCLMQISTRTEDFVLDTLKLRDYIGPYLRGAFSDPSKKKVMHGANHDILWLQRDFGIYVCNLFDTGQASRVLQLERNSLEYLLQYFCGVTANKEYQTADWRLRPLPEEMLKYAREDTHYLLHMYDLMRIRLLSTPTDSGNVDEHLVEVYRRSYDICTQLYEKELLTDASYLHIYGLQGADFDSKQLAVVAGLCEWRDLIARAEDESTGYVLPNKTLLEIAKHMPLSTAKLNRLVKSRHPYVEHNLGSVVGIIKSSIQNAAAFESASEELRKGRKEHALKQNIDPVMLDPETMPASEDPISGPLDMHKNGKGNSPETSIRNSPSLVEKTCEPENGQVVEQPLATTVLVRDVSQECPQASIFFPKVRNSFGLPGDAEEINKVSVCLSKGVNIASVQVLKKPNRAFGALLGTSASKRKLDTDSKLHSKEQGKTETKLEQIKSSVSLPFHTFSGQERLKPVSEEIITHFHSLHPGTSHEPDKEFVENSKLEEIISLESDVNGPKLPSEILTNDGLKHRAWFPRLPENSQNTSVETDSDYVGNASLPMSLSDLSSSFQKCYQSMSQMRNSRKDSDRFNQLRPFDYTAARKQMKFGGGQDDENTSGDGQSTHPGSGEARSSSSKVYKNSMHIAGEKELSQVRRRQAFPASGNRSATFR